MLDVDAFDRADAGREVEHLRLAERRRRVPAAVLLPDHWGVEALLDRGPDRERRGELVSVDGQVGAVPSAQLVDLGEELIGGVTGEDVGQPGLDAHADQCEPAGILPLSSLGELLVPELDAGLLVRLLGMRV